MTETQAIIMAIVRITKARIEATINPPVNTDRIDNTVRISSTSLKTNSSTRLEITKIINNTKRILERIVAILH